MRNVVVASGEAVEDGVDLGDDEKHGDEEAGAGAEV